MKKIMNSTGHKLYILFQVKKKTQEQDETMVHLFYDCWKAIYL